MAAEHPRVRAAVAFADTFAPTTGVSYGWVVARAKEQYANAEATFRSLDDKAGGIVTYLGGAAGAITLGLAGVTAADKVPLAVAIATVPAFGFAATAVMIAARARSPLAGLYPPAADFAAGRADHYHRHGAADPAGEAEASTVDQWHLAAEAVQAAAGRKAARVEAATWWFALSVAALALPLLTGIGYRLYQLVTAAPPP